MQKSQKLRTSGGSASEAACSGGRRAANLDLDLDLDLDSEANDGQVQA